MISDISSIEATPRPKKSLLISVYKGNISDSAESREHLEELALLALTYGLDVVHKEICIIRKYEASTLITSGKLEELQEVANQHRVELVVFDDEITPSQQRNLEAAFKLPVMDRTELILGVFAQRAQTKEARLQIELAQVKYQAPRLKRLWTHLSRQSGTSGGGSGGRYLKGEGEKQIEIDRRLLKKRIELLQKEIEEVSNNRQVQRASRKRSGKPVFSIIGYTNVGKSTLLNALTDADVLVEDKLFATLDTSTRKFILKNNQEILLIDTVGFIRKLPHLLVAAFRSTLEEAFQADILLHLIDASHPMAEEQAMATYEVLKELNSEDKPIITVLNKIDSCSNRATLQRLKLLHPNTVAISALKRTGFDALEEAMIEELNKQRHIVTLRIPQSHYQIASEVMRLGHVLSQSYDENDLLLQADLPVALVNKLAKYVQQQ